MYTKNINNHTKERNMKTLKTSILTLVASMLPCAAFAVDLSTWPADLLGAQGDALKSPKMTLMCSGHTSYYSQGGTLVQTSQHWQLVHSGNRLDSTGFNGYTSGFLQTSSSYTAGANSCLYTLDTATSKFAINKSGVGIGEVHWLTSSSNPNTCLGNFTTQVGFLFDKNSNLVMTQINDAQTTYAAEFSGSCAKQK